MSDKKTLLAKSVEFASPLSGWDTYLMLVQHMATVLRDELQSSNDRRAKDLGGQMNKIRGELYGARVINRFWGLPETILGLRTLSEPDPLLYSVARFQLWTLVGFYVAEQASWLKEKLNLGPISADELSLWSIRAYAAYLLVEFVAQWHKFRTGQGNRWLLLLRFIYTIGDTTTTLHWSTRRGFLTQKQTGRVRLATTLLLFYIKWSVRFA